MSTDVIASIVTAATALLVAVLSAVLAYTTRLRADSRIAELQSKLTEDRDARSAQRDYEYEARKSLYSELQPVLFQLADRAERALARIDSTVVAGARDGSVGWAGRLGTGWRDDPFHMISTVWDLVVPLAHYRILQQRLTSVDLSVDPRMQWQYTLIRAVYNSWSAGQLADIPPAVGHLGEERETRQIVLPGHLEQAVDHMLRWDNSGRAAVITYSEFEEKFFDARLDAFEHFSLPLTDMHPADKRLLWRILLVQAHLYSALTRAFHSFRDAEPDVVHPADAFSDEGGRFDWRPDDAQDVQSNVEADVRAARQYLRSVLTTPSVTSPKRNG